MKKCCGVHALRIAVGITMLALLLAGGVGAQTNTVAAFPESALKGVRRCK
jgi:hypothetical protein